MLDRVPTPGRENRVKITQDDGTVISGVLAYDDQATQEGSAYTKGNVLTDDACTLLELDKQTSEPKDAFMILGLINAEVYGRIEIKIINSSGIPMNGIAFNIDSIRLTTNAEGIAFVDMAAGTHTARFTSALDLSFSSSTLKVQSVRGKISRYTVTATTYQNNQRIFTSSGTFVFSPNVDDFDVFCVGGGGSGAVTAAARDAYILASGASGGGGGYTKTLLGKKNESGKNLNIVIGAGGRGVSVTNTKTITTSGYEVTESSNGNAGGTTSVSYGGDVICSAEGGEGGKYDNSNGRSGGFAKAAKGGNGSARVAMWREQTSSDSYGNYYKEKSYCGADGEDPYFYSSVTSYPQDNPPEKHVLTGFSQGSTTREFGEPYGTQYSTPGDGTFVCTGAGSMTGYTLGTGNDADYEYGSGMRSGSATSPDVSNPGGGSGGAVVHGYSYSNNTAVNFNATSGNGGDGLVIVRWRYKQ